MIINGNDAGDHSSEGGGGIMSYSANLTLNDVQIFDNTSTGWGGGAHLRYGEVIFNNVLIYNNEANISGGGLGLQGITAHFNHITVANNDAPESGGIHRVGGGTFSFNNMIIQNNQNGSYFTGYEDITYSNIEGYEGYSEDTTNIDVDPLFTDPENGDFSLQTNSPCIGSGDPNPWLLDVDGSRSDMGATGGPFYTINFEEWHFALIGNAGGTEVWELYNFRRDGQIVTIDSINISSSSFTSNVTFPMEIHPFEKGEIPIHMNNSILGNVSGVMTVYSEQINNNEGAEITLSGLAEGGNILCGDISGTLDSASYRVTCDIEVLENTQLDIEAGTELLFDGPHQFISHGTVTAIGTESDSIIFDNYDHDIPPGSKWYGILLYSASDETIFDYVRISNSRWDNGGLYLDNSAPLILHSLINHNTGTNSNGGAGGVFLAGSNGAVFTDVTFSNNSGPYGGAVKSNSASATFTNVNIINNEGDGHYGGGGILSFNSSLTFINCNIINNSSGKYGSAISMNTSSTSHHTFINTNILNNYNTSPGLLDWQCETYADSGYVEGPLCYGGAITIPVTGYGGVLYNTIKMVNSIVRGNYDSFHHGTDSAYTVTHNFAIGSAYDYNPIVLAYSNVENYEVETQWYGYNFNPPNPSPVNWDLEEIIDADPLFTDPENGDYSLSWVNYPDQDSTMSPCIDAGTPYLSNYGYDDITVYMGSAPDIGAFESEYITTSIIPGCTDPEASNYDPEANMDDGSCEYCSGPSEICVSYNTGWNIVGLPVGVEDASYQALFPNAQSNSLYSFDGVYQLQETLELGVGYLLRLTSDDPVTFTGTPINEITVSLSAGWNLFTGISSSLSVDDVYTQDIIQSGTIYGLDGVYFPPESIDPGMGYWVRATEDGEITLSSGASAKQVSFVNRVEEANSISFSNGAYSTKLYFGVDIPEEEILSYSLPPVFPQMAFDIRFAGDSRVVTESGEIEVVNTTETLTLSYDIPIEAGEHMNWVLISKTAEKFVLENTGELTVSSEERFVLNRISVLPETFTLHQNFPNPFNPITTLRYDLPSDGLVTLSIYDMLGREITQLVNTTQEAGFKSVQWDATDSIGRPVSAGVYLYKIQAGEFAQTKKMVLLK